VIFVELSAASRQLAGILFLALVTVETGGLYLLTIVRNRAETTPFQERFAVPGMRTPAFCWFLRWCPSPSWTPPT
jgi:hypothetical protein